jgi:hypothetical protein
MQNVCDGNKELIENISIAFRREKHQKQKSHGTFIIQQDDQATSGTRI